MELNEVKKLYNEANRTALEFEERNTKFLNSIKELTLKEKHEFNVWIQEDSGIHKEDTIELLNR